MKKLALVIVIAFAPVAALADGLKGSWLTEEGKGQVVFEDCGGNLCGKIVWLRDPTDAAGRAKTDAFNEDRTLRTRPVVGIKLGEMHPDANGRWTGMMYSPKDGKSYNTEAAIQKDGSLLLRGCVLGGLLCGDRTWTRVTEKSPHQHPTPIPKSSNSHF